VTAAGIALGRPIRPEPDPVEGDFVAIEAVTC
jgi:hypothetical protein